MALQNTSQLLSLSDVADWRTFRPFNTKVINYKLNIQINLQQNFNFKTLNF
jgi:hypothetical protein